MAFLIAIFLFSIKKNNSVTIDLLNDNELQFIRQKNQLKEKISQSKSSNKRYLILIYHAEYDRIYYPLSLRYCGKPNRIILIGQIRQLTMENQLLKAQVKNVISVKLES